MVKNSNKYIFFRKKDMFLFLNICPVYIQLNCRRSSIIKRLDRFDDVNMSECVCITFSHPWMLREKLFWGKIFEIGNLQLLYVLRFSESRSEGFSLVCMCVFQQHNSKSSFNRKINFDILNWFHRDAIWKVNNDSIFDSSDLQFAYRYSCISGLWGISYFNSCAINIVRFSVARSTWF